MVTPNCAIPIDSKILVIGSNGYIGSHIVNVLLSLGYDVREPVRTPRPWLDQYFKGKYGEDKFESVFLPVFDLDSLDHVMDGVSGVIHGTASEREAWEWMKEHQPGFVFNTVLPNTNWGRVLLRQIGGSTGNMLRGLLKGDKSGMQSPPLSNCESHMPQIHAITLLDPYVSSERLFAFAAPQNWNDVIGIIHKLRPDNPLIPDSPVNEPRDLSNVPGSKRAAQLLSNFFGQPGFIGLEDTIAATIEGHN
ncbi:hypothetical protein V1522DRAFT_424383 [Lipomyces starkeyi]